MNGAPNLRRFSSWMYLPEMHVELSRTMDPIRIPEIAIFFQEEYFRAVVASMLSPGPACSFPAIPASIEDDAH